MKSIRSFTAILLLAVMALPPFATAQSGPPAKSLGTFYASQYAQWRVPISIGTSASGAGTITLSTGVVTLPGGVVIQPFSTTAPINVYDAATDTVTPTTVSGCASGALQDSCQITATFTAVHGKSLQVGSGTHGVQEAINDAIAAGGGVVVVDSSSGATNADITGASGAGNVVIQDVRAGLQYYALKPSTLTALATPATRSATAGATQVIDATSVGTFANASQFVCVTYVDALGGESPCSASFSYTAAGSLGMFFASPAASTGAVGWRAYAGITGTSTQYQLPITSTTCTLSTLETLYPACAIGASATFAAPTTATALAPGYVVNTYRPNPQSHTTMAYAATNAFPVPGFQSHYGPFIASAGGTTGQIEVLGTIPLPSAYLNAIGKSVRVSGHITMTAGTSETPVLKVQLGPTFSTGTPTNICQFANTTALSAAAYSLAFTCTLTTNAIGASGTVMPDGMAVVALGAGTTAGTSMPELGTAAITDSLSGVDNIYVTYIPTSGTNTAAQLLDLHVESLN